MIPDGTYAARATTATLGETKSGKEQVAVEFEIQSLEGGKITWYGYFTEKTTERTLESLRICGWNGSDLTDLSGIDANEVEIVVAAEEFEGKVRSKVQWINKPGGMGLQAPLSPEKAKAFAARMKGQILAFDQKAGASAPKRTAPQPRNTTRAPQHRNADADVFTEDKPPF